MTCSTGLATSASKRYSAGVVRVCLSQPELLDLDVAELPSCNSNLFVLLFFYPNLCVCVRLPECSAPGQAATLGPTLHIQFNNFYVKCSYESQRAVFM